jgi:hypothetical protein
MLHRVTSSYHELARLVPGLVCRTPSSALKKQQLLEMANNGEARPAQRSKLGSALCSYTAKSSSCYDSLFDKQIRNVRPDWFVSKYQVSERKKKDLIKMANEAKPRPNRKHPLGMFLSHVTSKKSEVYDPIFDKQIRNIRPDWFVSKHQVAMRKKDVLLGMAKRGELRPNRKHPFGKVLSNYTRKKSQTYDPIFSKKIKKLAPHWFEKCSTQ